MWGGGGGEREREEEGVKIKKRYQEMSIKNKLKRTKKTKKTKVGKCLYYKRTFFGGKSLRHTYPRCQSETSANIYLG